MSTSGDEPKAWKYQSEFLQQARELIERVFFRLGIEAATPRIGLAALGWWKDEQYKHPPFAEKPDPRMLWNPARDSWHNAVLTKADDRSDAKAMQMFLERSSRSTIDFHNVIQNELRTHDAISGSCSFVSEGVRVGSYDCVFVLEGSREAFDALPHIVLSLSNPDRLFTVGLLNSVMQSLLDRLASESRKGDSGLSGWLGVDERDVDDVLRNAGDHLLSALRVAVLDGLHSSTNLFEDMNAIASLRYESSEPKATIVFGKKEHDGPFEFKFKDMVPLSQATWARKTAQLASDAFSMFSDTEHFLGLVYRERPRPGEFWIRLKGQGRWELGVGDKPLANAQFGIVSFPTQRHDRQRFESTFRRIFAPPDSDGLDRISALVEDILKENHGALIVVAEKAAVESERLSSQATQIEPTKLSGKSAARATAIDGALLLDPTGICHAIGVILDGEAHLFGTPSRGARFNSAVRYVCAKEDVRRLAVVISEDGQVDLLPRLPPRIKKSEFLRFLNDFLSYPDDKPLPAEFKDYCIKMVRHYSLWMRIYVHLGMEHFSPDLDEAGREEFLMRALRRLGIRDRPDRIPLQYDLHKSDFIDDMHEGPQEESSGNLPDDQSSSSEG